MPGHKRNERLMGADSSQSDVFDLIGRYDITEIDGFDNLHHPTGILREEMEHAAKSYGAKRTFYLVNGSSSGLMAAVMGLCGRGDTILMARNCHTSVYNAVVEKCLKPVYIFPSLVDNLWISREIHAQDVENKLKELVDNCDSEGKYGKIAAVILPSPTYEGFVSDVEKIARIAHAYEIPLIVDEAHGAHFRYHGAFPESALALGADCVIQSLHKTLPSFTQTALLHIGADTILTDEAVARISAYLDMLQTTSPSYLLMASISRCLGFMQSKEGEQRMCQYVERLTALRSQIRSLRNIRLLETDDISKIVLYTDFPYLQGKAFCDILLHDYGIQLEMAAGYYVLAMTAVGDTPESYEYFYKALRDIDSRLEACSMDAHAANDKAHAALIQAAGEQVYTPGAVFCMPQDSFELVEPEQAAQRICARTVCVYPPDIPLIVAGERIPESMAYGIASCISGGFDVTGISEGKILCLK